MDDCTRKLGDEKEVPEFGHDSIEVAIRTRIRDTIEALVKRSLTRRSAHQNRRASETRDWAIGTARGNGR